MDINNLTIGQAKEIAKLVACTTGAVSTPAVDECKCGDAGKKVIVRSKDAGVLYGTLVKFEGSAVWLTDAIQMWKWKAVKGGTLIDCAEHGVVKSASKFSNKSASTVVLGACAIIEVAESAIKSLEEASW
jgi:ribosomal protein L14